MAGAYVSKKKKQEMTRFGILPATISFQIREPGSAITHFIGLLLTSIGAGPLLLRTRLFGSGMTFYAMCVFIAATCLLYAASTTYHTVVLDERRTTIFRKLDHVSISIMIAGTYTPVCLAVLKGAVGFGLLAAIWGLAIGGVALKVLWITCPKWISSVLYIAMGWLCVFAMGPLLSALPMAAFAWLLAGGLFYSAGAVIYAMHPKKFDARHIYFGSHEIFHVFIMLGTFCHFMLMYHFIAFL